MALRVPVGSVETPFVQTEAVSTKAPFKMNTQSPTGERFVDQALNQIFRSSSQVLLNSKDANSNPYLQGARKVIQNMHDLWKQKTLTDVTLECRDGVLYAHKLVMAAYSDSLCKRFADYPLSQAITISLKEYSTNSVFPLLEFMYTLQMNLNGANVGELLSLAKELGIGHVQTQCMNYLGNITLENCFMFLEIAIKHGLKDLQERVERFLSDNFSEVIKLDGFLKLSSERVIRLLNQSARTVRSELQLFQAIARWIEYQRHERLSLAGTLLRNVKLHQISARDLVNHVEKVDFMTGMPECFQMLYAAMTYHALQSSGGSASVRY